ncbi:cation:proton antiporter [Sphingomonas cannabina]|uniref:cation:proton antiporter n=1 Tax=Sphingomonas cannabina TaxID=2899123 RepID=UPI001F332195|nr:cation:proton antiporter [Sphingomonas cannabina]UIJ44071.1 cation:proton antiporter [Sphingomonas cannabina]
MTFFESLLALMLVAVLLLQVSRRLGLPYPTLLAAAGVAVGMIPGAPSILIAPETALALFLAPVLIDAAYDYPIGAARKLLAPLVVYAVVAVIVTALAVAGIGVGMLGLPLAAALTLGAIVAPPDAAAATAVLVNLPVARRIDALLKGESLFNDATALLLFTAALTVQQRGGLDGGTAAQLALAAPGGILFGIAYGWLVSRLQPLVGNTVGATLLQFVHAFLTWIIAEHLHLSAVLAVVASAMTIASRARASDSPRMRVHSFAVWTTVVFLLNVLAFLLMGLQARRIVAAMDAAEFARAAWFAGAVVLAAIVVRLVISFGYRWAVTPRHGEETERLSRAETFLLGWTGMRGLVTLATAFALPADFPERNTVVLAAFAVVLVTLVVQGATLAPFIRFFGISRTAEAENEIVQARIALAGAALERLEDEPGEEAGQLRDLYEQFRDGRRSSPSLDRRQGLALAAVLAQRERLDRLRAENRVGADAYLQLQEELDWKQLSVASDDERRIAES